MLTEHERLDLRRLVTSPNTNDFYRARLATLGDDVTWDAIPFITKAELAAHTLEARSRIPLSEIRDARPSSGTSGGTPFLSACGDIHHEYYGFQFHNFVGAYLTTSNFRMRPYWLAGVEAQIGRQPELVVFDVKEPRASAVLAKMAGVDAIGCFVAHIPAIGKALSDVGITEGIRLIDMNGENCTMRLFEYVRAIFPNATLIQGYGMNEIEEVHCGVPCRPINGTEPLVVYHARKNHYIELIDPDTGALLQPNDNREGELVVSTLPRGAASFPLLRYRTGDMVRVVEEQCAVHGEWSFTVLGRVAMDFLKVPGGVLRSDEVERVLRGLGTYVTDDFQLHRYEHMSDRVLKTQVVLAVERVGSASFEELARVISDVLRVNPARTYTEGVEDGLYLPLVCIELEKSVGTKHKRMVAH